MKTLLLERRPALPERKLDRHLPFTAALGSLLTSLDASAVNAVLPLIRGSFHTTISMVQWVLLGDLLITSGLLLAFGRLGDQLGHKRVYVAGFGTFLFGCSLCAVAPGITWLIAFRIVQGAGSAMLLASSPALLVNHLDSGQHGRALGLRACFIYLGLVAGPVVGGWLAGHYGWRAVFCMPLLVGAAGMALATRFICDDRSATRLQAFDFRGLGMWAGALGVLLFALNRGNVWGWTSPAVLFTLLVSAILLLAFLRAERHYPNALFDLRLFRSGAFSLAVATLALSYVAGHLLTFLLPFYLSQSQHMPPASIGVLLGSYGIIRAMAALLSGRVSDRIGARLAAAGGAALFAFGLFLLSRLTSESALGVVAVCVLVAGAGIGIFVPPNNSMLMGAVPRSRHGAAAGMLATSRTVGMGIGVALAGVKTVHTGFGLAFTVALFTLALCAAALRRTSLSKFGSR